LAALAALRDAAAKIRAEIRKVIVGQDQVVDQLLTAIFAQGHCLLEGVPGLAKTLMVSTLAQALDLSFHRIQFTPDLMPSDISGTEVIQEDKATGQRAFRFLKGPIFANVILADEINRTPPKTQAAMLEAMQEKHVSIGGQKHTLPDRFMFKVFVNYPQYDEEYRIAEATTAEWNPRVDHVLNAEAILDLHGLVRRIPVAPHVVHYALRLVRATRVQEGDAPAFIREWVSWGAGPRGVQYLLLGGKSRAALAGRTFVNTDDVRAVAHPVLRHRIITNFHAESEGVKPDQVIDRLLETVPEEGRDEAVDKKLEAAFDT
jgi:MoxR-like ATPase